MSKNNYMNLKRIAAAVVLVSCGVAAQAANVAIVTGSFYTPDLKNQLVAHGNTVTEISSYTAASLTSYNAVISYGNDYVNFAALSAYANAGGTVIETPWFWLNNTPTADMDIFSQGGSAQYSTANPGVTVLDAGNPLLSGVSFPAAGAPFIGRTGGNTFAAGVTGVANWSDGTAFIGEKSLGAGKIIGINLHVITSDTAYGVINTPWASQLFSNAVTAVPEPETYAMLLAGLGLVGFAARRKA